VARALSEQTVVITGASSGIGRAAALRFAVAGARVVLAARHEPSLEETAAEIRNRGGDALVVPTDVTDAAAVAALANAAAAWSGRMDTWVNAAAVAIYGRADDLSPRDFARVMDVNYLGTVHGCLAALPHLRAAGGGVLVNVSSVLGARAIPLQSAYVASKWAVRGFSDTLRMELQESDDDIAVTTILPSSIDTPLFAHAAVRGAGWRPRPVPPVYAPDVVARAIVRAAEHPTREVVVGSAGAVLNAMQRLAPAATDRLMTLGHLASRVQQRGAGRTAVNVEHAAPGALVGDFQGPVMRHSTYTSLVAQHPTVGRALGAAAVAALLVRRRRRGSPTSV
jgi:NADP-dependent 3-hydroxy acid dehydrogenase YdfG